jgi:hypothetical protein
VRCKRERQEGGLARAEVEEERRIAHPTLVEERCHLIRAYRIWAAPRQGTPDPPLELASTTGGRTAGADYWHFLASLLRIGLGPIPINGARNAVLASPSKDTKEH